MRRIHIVIAPLVILAAVITTGCNRITDLPDDVEMHTSHSTTSEQMSESQPLESITSEQTNGSQPAESSSSEQTSESQPVEDSMSEQAEAVLSVDEAQEFLSWYFRDISYMPDRNKQEEGVQHYCFLVEYPEVRLRMFESYVWVNSVTWDLVFEEHYYYANIPDNRIPVPMLNEIEIPYDRFVPPYSGYQLTSYMFTDTSVEESYQAQLRESGFEDKGEVAGFDILWIHEHYDDGATILVGIKHFEGSLYIDMYISYSMQFDFDSIWLLCEF